MTKAELDAYVNLYLQPGVDPVLTPEELDVLFSGLLMADSTGKLPNEEGYIPTYDGTNLEVQIGKGWLAKASKASGDYQFSDNGLSLHRDQVYTHCIEMAEKYGQAEICSLRPSSVANY
jgi:hypothetical protein